MNSELQIESYWTVVHYNPKNEMMTFIYSKYKNMVQQFYPRQKWTISLWIASFCYKTEFN